MSVELAHLINFLKTVYPLELAEGFDNTGLLVGHEDKSVKSVMTCLTVSPETITEAIENQADLIVSHHPFPFLMEKKWTSSTPTGRALLAIMEAGLAIYSPHTAHDSALFGINEQIALRLNLQNIQLLQPKEIERQPEMYQGVPSDIKTKLSNSSLKFLGNGRWGNFSHPISLRLFVDKVHEILNCPTIQVIGQDEHLIQKVAIGCGAAFEFIEDAARVKADVFLTGEARFHDGLKAKAMGIDLVLPGHYYSERFAMDVMAERISNLFPELTVWASRKESDPVRFV